MEWFGRGLLNDQCPTANNQHPICHLLCSEQGELLTQANSKPDAVLGVSPKVPSLVIILVGMGIGAGIITVRTLSVALPTL